MQEQLAEKLIQRRNRAKRWLLEVPYSLETQLILKLGLLLFAMRI